MDRLFPGKLKELQMELKRLNVEVTGKLDGVKNGEPVLISVKKDRTKTHLCVHQDSSTEDFKNLLACAAGLMLEDVTQNLDRAHHGLPDAIRDTLFTNVGRNRSQACVK